MEYSLKIEAQVPQIFQGVKSQSTIVSTNSKKTNCKMERRKTKERETTSNSNKMLKYMALNTHDGGGGYHTIK